MVVISEQVGRKPVLVVAFLCYTVSLSQVLISVVIGVVVGMKVVFET